jgi:hypothetical protein
MIRILTQISDSIVLYTLSIEVCYEYIHTHNFVAIAFKVKLRCKNLSM